MSEVDAKMVDILLPQSGMGMQDGEIFQWFKSEGAEISEGEMIVEIEAAKAIVEIPAPCDGVLQSIEAEAGEVVEVRAVIGRILPKV